MLHVLGWLYEDTDDTPAMLLAAHGNRLAASRVRATANLTLKQKDGLYDGARRSLEVLDEPAYAAWVTPPARARFGVDAGQVTAFCLAQRTHELPSSPRWTSPLAATPCTPCRWKAPNRRPR